MPGAVPLTLDEVKGHLRITHTTQDDYLSLLLEAGVDFAEEVTRRTFINRPVEALYAGFPCCNDFLVLPGYPVNDVTEVKYLDVNGEEQELDSATYRVIAGDRGKLLLAFNQEWPSIAYNQYGPVTVTFVAGYGAAATSVPARVKLTLLQLIADAYEHTEAQSEISLSANIFNRDLLASLRIPVVM